VTLKTDFEGDPGLEELGGPSYLARLFDASISGSMISDYAEELVRVSEQRRVYEVLTAGAQAIRDRKPLDEVKASVEVALSEVKADGKENSISLLKAFTHTLGRMAKAYEGEEDMGIRTQIAALDARLGGLFAPDLLILAGRPSMGKTALATSLAIRTARQNIPVGIVSIEMDSDGLAQRILSELSGVPYFKYRRAGEMTESEMRSTAEAAKANEALPIHIVPPHVRDIGGIYASLKKIDRHFENMGGLGLVVVDYLQLARAKGNSTNERIAEISMGLKNIAKMLNCPVIALSQLSRQVEYREDKRPVLSDLRDSGQIEQDADVVLFCYRDYYYQSREPEKKDPEERTDQLVALEQSRNVMEVITAKQRFGPIGSDRIGCAIETNRFWDLQAPTNQEELEF
jgi:replicative DNA helicase